MALHSQTIERTTNRNAQRILALLLTGLLLVLSACGVGTQNSDTSRSSQTAVSEEQTEAVLQELAQQLKDGKIEDPKSYQGPTTVSGVPEVQAMVDTPTPQLPVTFKDFKGEDVTSE